MSNKWGEQSGGGGGAGGSYCLANTVCEAICFTHWLVVSTSKLHELLKLCQVTDRMHASAPSVQRACARTAHKDNGKKGAHSGRVQEEVVPLQTGTLSCFLINSQCDVKILQINELFCNY